MRAKGILLAAMSLGAVSGFSFLLGQMTSPPAPEPIVRLQPHVSALLEAPPRMTREPLASEALTQRAQDQRRPEFEPEIPPLPAADAQPSKPEATLTLTEITQMMEEALPREVFVRSLLDSGQRINAPAEVDITPQSAGQIYETVLAGAIHAQKGLTSEKLKDDPTRAGRLFAVQNAMLVSILDDLPRRIRDGEIDMRVSLRPERAGQGTTVTFHTNRSHDGEVIEPLRCLITCQRWTFRVNLSPEYFPQQLWDDYLEVLRRNDQERKTAMK